MSKSSTNLSIDSDLKKAAIDLFSDLGLDLSSAVTLFQDALKDVFGDA